MGAGAYIRTTDDEEVFIFPIDVDQDLSAAMNTLSGLASNPAGIPRALSDANDAVQKATNIDPFGYVSTFTALKKAAQQYQLLGAWGRAYVKEINGKEYIIFKGVAGSRPNLNGTRYLKTNPKVACFVVGGKDILMDGMHATRLAVFVYVGIDVYSAIVADHSSGTSFAALGIKIASDIAQSAVATAGGVLAGAFLSIGGAPVVVTFVIVILIGLGIGVVLNAIDGRFKLTEQVQDYWAKIEATPGSLLYRFHNGACGLFAYFWTSGEDMLQSFVSRPTTAYDLRSSRGMIF